MAYESSPQEEDDKEQNGMDVISSSQGAGIQQQAGPTTGQAKGGSGQFTNIQEYIEANRPKTTQLSEGITQDVKQQVGGLKSELGKTRESFLGQQGKYGTGQSEFIQQQLKQVDKPGYAPSAEDVKRFRSLAEKRDAAPDLGKQRRQAADIQSKAKEFGTSKGRFQALQKLVGKQSATYGKGQRQLDQMLLAGDRQSRLKGVRDVREATAGLEGQVSSLGSDIEAARTARQTEAQQVQGLAATSRQQIADAVEKRARVMSAFAPDADKSYTAQELQDVGLSVGERTYGADVAQFYGAAATPEQLARANALARLSGREGAGFNLTGAQLGSNVGFDQAALKAQIGQNKQAFEQSEQAYAAASPRGKEIMDEMRTGRGWRLGGQSSRDVGLTGAQDYLDRFGGSGNLLWKGQSIRPAMQELAEAQRLRDESRAKYGMPGEEGTLEDVGGGVSRGIYY